MQNIIQSLLYYKVQVKPNSTWELARLVKLLLLTLEHCWRQIENEQLFQRKNFNRKAQHGSVTLWGKYKAGLKRVIAELVVYFFKTQGFTSNRFFSLLVTRRISLLVS